MNTPHSTTTTTTSTFRVPLWTKLIIETLLDPFRVQLAHEAATATWRRTLRQSRRDQHDTDARVQHLRDVIKKIGDRATGCRFDVLDVVSQDWFPVVIKGVRKPPTSREGDALEYLLERSLGTTHEEWKVLDECSIRPQPEAMKDGVCIAWPEVGTPAYTALAQSGDLHGDLPPTGMVWMARAFPTDHQFGRIVKVRGCCQVCA